jgi:hypothetical protein
MQVSDREAVCGCRLVTLWWTSEACRQHKERLGEGVDVGRERVGVDRVEDQLVGGVVRRAQLLAADRQLSEVRSGDQAEVADQPASVQLVEVARLDVAVAHIPFRKAGQRLRNLGERGDDGVERSIREDASNRRGDRHR